MVFTILSRRIPPHEGAIMRKNGIIISILNNKGGVGKTTATCNLAHALTKLGKKVLVIDMDSQCNSTSLLLSGNKDQPNSLFELLSPDSPDFPAEKCIYPTSYVDLYCIPNIQDTAGLEPDFITEAPESFFVLRKKVREYAQSRFDYTIIDNPPNMGTFVIISLYCSDFVIVPIEAGSAFSIEGLTKAIKLINNIRNNGNEDLRFLRLLINKLDRRTSESKAALTYISDVFSDDQVFETIIPSCASFQKAERANETILRHAPSTSGNRAYRSLAEELDKLFPSKTES